VLRVCLVEDLLEEPLPAGSNLLVEYDPASRWYAASITIAAEWLRSGGRVNYRVAAQPPDNIRSQLRRLGLNPEELESDGRLIIWDWYTATLGRKSKEKFSVDSLKAADLSVWYSKYLMGDPGPSAIGWGKLGPEVLRLGDDTSCLGRFNEEKSWVELVVARASPSASMMKSTRVVGVIRSVHSEWAYKILEAAADGIIDFKLEEVADKVGEQASTIFRLRNMKNVGFDGRWQRLTVGKDSKITLEN
jgi:KaiC/GvpD/RAD55 family RecA-like ATPase